MLNSGYLNVNTSNEREWTKFVFAILFVIQQLFEKKPFFQVSSLGHVTLPWGGGRGKGEVRERLSTPATSSFV